LGIFRLGARLVERSSLFTWVGMGLVVALSVPAVRTRLRSGLVFALGGVLAVAKPLGEEAAKIIGEATTVGKDVIKLETDAAELLEEGEKLVGMTQV